MSERVNAIRDGRASFREEKLAKDLSWRVGELETLLLAVLYFFAKDGRWDPLGSHNEWISPAGGF